MHTRGFGRRATRTREGCWLGVRVSKELFSSPESLQAYLVAVIQSADDAIITKDLNGIVRSWNGAAERIFGYTAAEIIGKPIALLVPPERPNEEPQILERLRR